MLRYADAKEQITPAHRNSLLRAAEAVKAFLVAEGISEERMEAVGMGKSRPIAEGRSKDARSANRRVEFVIINE